MKQAIRNRIEQIKQGQVPEGYKKTEVGIIPIEWEEKYLLDICITIGVYGINAPSCKFNKNLPTYLRITDIDHNGNFSNKNRVSVNDKNSENYFLEQNDIVYARTGATVGKTYLYNKKDGELVYAGFLIKFSIDYKKYNPILLKNYCHTRQYWNWVKTISARSGQPGINAEEYSKMFLPIPKTTEQQKIAKILSTWDKAISLQEKLLEKLELQKKALMKKLLTPKEGWGKVKLGEICNITMGQSPKSEYYNSDGEGLPLIQGNTDIQERKTIVRQYASNYSKTAKAGLIIMSVRAPVGYVAKTEFDCCLGRGVCGIEYKNDYIYRYLIFKQNMWTKLSTGSTFDSITSVQVNNFTINLPLEPHQQYIANVLSKADENIQLQSKKLVKLKEQQKAMQQLLLTGIVRV